MKHDAFILITLHNAECQAQGAIPVVYIDWDAWLQRKPSESEATSLSRTLASLEERGLLRRLPHRMVILTKAGATLAAELKSHIDLVDCIPKAGPAEPLDAENLDGSTLGGLIETPPQSSEPSAVEKTTDIQPATESTPQIEFDEPDDREAEAVHEPNEPMVHPFTHASPVADNAADAPQSPPEISEAEFGPPPSSPSEPLERKPIRLSDLRPKKPVRWVKLWSSNEHSPW